MEWSVKNLGTWRINNGVLCVGTLRIASMDYDTNPNEAFRSEIEAYITEKLNQKADLKSELAQTRNESQKLREALTSCVELLQELPTLNGLHGLAILEHAKDVLGDNCKKDCE